MAKKHQNDNDFDMINLDETAGWNQLEVEAALENIEPEIDYFDEEEEYEDPVTGTYTTAGEPTVTEEADYQ